MVDTSRQKELFEDIHEKYYASSADDYATSYKEEFVYNHVLNWIGDSASVIEIASGTGAGVLYLKDRLPKLEIAGCDISEKAAAEFREIHHSPCYVADMTKPFSIGRKFDAAIVMGGIHHLVADLDMAFENISGLLNPNGRLIMVEPNADYMLEPLRKLWYRLDKSNFDSANENALSHRTLVSRFLEKFEPVHLRYFGGPAYYLLMLNWVLRIPNGTKKWTAPGLMAFERMFVKMPGPWPFASFIACWHKR